jgi:hypothetical protein
MKINNVVIALTISCCFGIMNGANRLYLENQYGRTIRCRINGSSGVPVGHYSRILLGSIKEQDQNFVKSLSVSAGSMLSMYSSLDKVLNAIRAEHLARCGDYRSVADCDQDAILVINPGGYMGSWNVEAYWERDNSFNVDTFEMEDFDPSSVLRTLRQFVENKQYDNVVAFVKERMKFLQSNFSAGQINAIATGSHPGADANQHRAALRFIDRVLDQ